MIEKLKLKNFQSHKNSVVDFGPGVNAITGPSHSGKSGCIRSLRLLAFNRPMGDGYRSDWTDDPTVVEIQKDEKIISRTKGNNKNEYQLDDLVFKAFGKNPPEEIVSALNLEEINFQNQHDPPFLLTKTPSEIAKYLNEIVNLDIIDESLSKAKRKVRETKDSISGVEWAIEEKETLVKSTEWVKEADEKLSRIERKNDRTKTINEEIKILQTLIDEIETERETNRLWGEFIEFTEGILKTIDEKTKRVEIISNKISVLSVIINEIKIENEKINSYNELLKLENKITKIEENTKEVDKINAELKNIDDLILSISQEEKTILKWVKTISSIETKYDEVLGDRCPLCGAEYI